jgi:plasmid stabilization system protein ParE
MKEVQWTETARKTLQDTSDFLLELWSTSIEEEFIEQLDYRISQFQNNPELGSTFDNTQIRRLIIHKTVSLFYINTPQYIKLLVIWDNRKDPNKLLKKLTDGNEF